MEQFVFILMVSSALAGTILCVDHNDNVINAVDTDDYLDRIALKQQMNELMLKMDNVLSENKQMKNEIYELNNRVAAIENEKEQLKNELINMKSGISSQEDHYGDHTTVLKSDIQGRVDSDVQRIRRTENEVVVAFYARLSNHLLHEGVNQLIIFENIMTNEGNAYSNHTGNFRAPVAGIYVFSTTLMSYSTQTHGHFHFAKNGATVDWLYLDGRQAQYASTSGTIVLRLDAGDDVAIRNVDPDQSLNGGYCTFSGFLLQQDYSQTVGAIVG